MYQAPKIEPYLSLMQRQSTRGILIKVCFGVLAGLTMGIVWSIFAYLAADSLEWRAVSGINLAVGVPFITGTCIGLWNAIIQQWIIGSVPLSRLILWYPIATLISIITTMLFIWAPSIMATTGVLPALLLGIFIIGVCGCLLVAAQAYLAQIKGPALLFWAKPSILGWMAGYSGILILMWIFFTVIVSVNTSPM